MKLMHVGPMFQQFLLVETFPLNQAGPGCWMIKKYSLMMTESPLIGKCSAVSSENVSRA